MNANGSTNASRRQVPVYDVDGEPTTTYRSFASITPPKPSLQDPLAAASLSSSRARRHDPPTSCDESSIHQHGSHDDTNEEEEDSQHQSHQQHFGSVANSDFRGFSTSIGDMFGSISSRRRSKAPSLPQTAAAAAADSYPYYYPHERVDCCAMTCCGMLQSDRDRFLMTGVLPPGPMKRLTVHIALPCCIFFVAGLGAIHIADPVMNQIASTMLVLFLFYYFFMQCYKGRMKRIRVRKDLLFTKYQVQRNMNNNNNNNNNNNLSLLLEQERPESPNDDNAHYFLGQGPWDFACAHPCCLIGCYADDRKHLNHDHNNNNNNNSEEQEYASDLCDTLWTYCFPSPICGMHLQCCGTCALAQEARELETAVLPPKYRRIDYITMQPIMEYYPSIYRAKWAKLLHENNNNNNNNNNAANNNPASSPLAQSQQDDLLSLAPSLAHADSFVDTTGVLNTFPPPLSRLSYRLFQWLSLLIALTLAYSILRPLYWKHIMKQYHPNAFNLYDFLVFLLVFVQAICLLAILAWITNRPKYSALSLDAMIKFFASGFLLSTSLAVFWELVLGLLVRLVLSLLMAVAGVDVVADPDTSASRGGGGFTGTKSDHDHSGSGSGGAIYLIPLPPRALSGFPLLAGTESVSNDGSTQDFLESFGRNHPVFYTFYILFATFFLAAFVEEVCKYFGYRMCDEHPDLLSKQDLTEASEIVYAETEEQAEEGLALRRQTRHHSWSRQRQSFQEQGAAITLAMICVAMGFTCCENLVYVLIYSASSPQMELYVLLARSIFPVHPICAALQSIGVCQREVEGQNNMTISSPRRITLTRILYPAVLVHGAYDFFIIWIDFLANRKEDVNDNNGGVNVDWSAVGAVLSFMISVVLMLAAIWYYLHQARSQRRRLVAMDEQVSVERSQLL